MPDNREPDMTEPAASVLNAPTPATDVVTSALLRLVFLGLGLLFTALGVIGAFVPLMPSTIFLIIAAWFFARSSARLEAWLLGHRRFGPILVAWRREGAIPRRAKILACMGMALGLLIFTLTVHVSLWVTLAVYAAILACAAFVVSRPEPRL